MSDRENLTRYIEISMTNKSRRAHSTMNLRSLEDFGVEFGIVTLELGDLSFQLLTRWLN
jgi:hypothetical protein